MPAAWIGAGAAVLGAGSSIAGGNSNSNAVSAADPYAPFQGQSDFTLNAGANINGAYGFGQNSSGNGGLSGANTISGLNSYVNNQTIPLTGALNGQGYAQQINSLVSNPSSVATSAGYQAALGQGLSAVGSTAAAQGLNGSGNQLAALQNYGTSFEQNSYNTQLSQLSGLYGQSLSANQQGYNQAAGTNTQSYNQLAQLAGLQGNAATTAAGGLIAQGNQQQSQAVSNGVSGLATAGQNLWNTLSSGTGAAGSEVAGAASSSTPDDLISGY